MPFHHAGAVNAMAIYLDWLSQTASRPGEKTATHEVRAALQRVRTELRRGGDLYRAMEAVFPAKTAGAREKLARTLATQLQRRLRQAAARKQAELDGLDHPAVLAAQSAKPPVEEEEADTKLPQQSLLSAGVKTAGGRRPVRKPSRVLT